MEKITGNEPAQPIQPTFNSEGQICDESYKYEGLTIKQLMAKDFMASYITHCINTTTLLGRIKTLFGIKSTVELSSANFQEISRLSCAAADALIAELNKPL